MNRVVARRTELERYVDPHRVALAARAEADLVSFCLKFGLAVDAAGVTLYITSLVQDQPPSGRALRTRVQLLDLARRLGGNTPWTADPDLRRYLRGLHKDFPLGGGPRSDPLYRELVEALIDSVMAPTYNQVQAVAAVLLVNEARMSVNVLLALRWRDVVVERHGVRIRPPALTCSGSRSSADVSTQTYYRHVALADALRKLRVLSRTADSAIFAAESGAVYRDRLDIMLKPLREQQIRRRSMKPIRGRPLDGLLQVARTATSRQLRDRALLAMAFGAALRGHEAIALRRSGVQVRSAGLIVHLENRPGPIGVAASPDRFCPIAAWQAWDDARGASIAGARAFPQMSGSKIWSAASTAAGLNEMVRTRSEEAGLLGRYSFTSLRTGYIRTALRAGLPSHVIAAHADLTSLTSVRRHERREHLLRQNVAGQVGL